MPWARFAPGECSWRRLDAVVLTAIIGAFIVIQTVVLLDYSSLGDQAVEADFLAEIAPAAQHLAAGNLAVADYPFKGPVSAIVLALLHAVTGILGLDLFRTGNLLSLLSAGASLFFVYRLGLELWGRRTAVAATLLAAANNVFFINAHKAASDHLFLAITLGALWLALRAPLDRRRLLLLGALGGLAFLTRYIGAVVPLWLAGVVFLLRTPRPLRAVGWLVCGFAVVVAPWIALNLAQTGSLLATRNGQNVVQAFHADRGSVADLVARYVRNLLSNVRSDTVQVLGWPLVAVAIAGLAAMSKGAADRRRLAVIGWGVVYAAACGVVFHMARFSLPLVPVYALLGASLLDRLPRRLPLVVVPVLLFALFQQADLSRASVAYYRGQQPEYLRRTFTYLDAQAANWPGPGRPRIMARKPHVAWYGRMDYVPYPGRLAGAPGLLDQARKAGADFLNVGTIERASYVGSEFLDKLDGYDGVTRVFEADGNIVYRLGAVAAAPQAESNSAIALLKETWRAALAANDADRIAAAGTPLVQALDRDGRVREALEIGTLMLDHARPQEELVVRLYLGLACLKLGNTTRGLGVLERYLADDHPGNRPEQVAKGCVIVGQLHTARGDRAAALTWLDRALALYRQLGMQNDVNAVQGLVARLRG
jgi:tetratricopeptide (TPR) repeat protein